MRCTLVWHGHMHGGTRQTRPEPIRRCNFGIYGENIGWDGGVSGIEREGGSSFVAVSDNSQCHQAGMARMALLLINVTVSCYSNVSSFLVYYYLLYYLYMNMTI